MEMKVGIIGCGGIAGSHISGYKENQIEVTAIADIALDAEKRAKELVPDAKFFNDAGSLLKSGLVNAVSICTPPLGHEATALEAIKNNIHVLCEKPLGFDIEASRKIHEAAANSNVQFMTAFRHRFIPGVKKLKELIDQGAIGQPIWFRNTFCSPAFDMVDKWYSKKEIAGGGTLMDTSIHSVDIFRYLFGEVSDQHLVAHQHLQATDVEDVSIISLKSAEGVLGTCYASWVSGTKIFEIDIMGPNQLHTNLQNHHQSEPAVGHNYTFRNRFHL